jgi:hypothetical protein
MPRGVHIGTGNGSVIYRMLAASWSMAGNGETIHVGLVQLWKMSCSGDRLHKHFLYCLVLVWIYVYTLCCSNSNSHAIFFVWHFFSGGFLSYGWYSLDWPAFSLVCSPRDSHQDVFCRCRLRDDMSSILPGKNAYSFLFPYVEKRLELFQSS